VLRSQICSGNVTSDFIRGSFKKYYPLVFEITLDQLIGLAGMETYGCWKPFREYFGARLPTRQMMAGVLGDIVTNVI
jgi:hypothetical protein